MNVEERNASGLTIKESGLLISVLTCTFTIFSLESREFVQRLTNLNTPITNPDSGEICHRLAVALGVHRNALLAHRRQHLEVVDIESRREGVEELGLLIERIGEGVR
jgi:hypothetical protein